MIFSGARTASGAYTPPRRHASLHHDQFLILSPPETSFTAISLSLPFYSNCLQAVVPSNPSHIKNAFCLARSYGINTDDMYLPERILRGF